MSALEYRLSSSLVSFISFNLRAIVLSPVRCVFFMSCWLIVEAPWLNEREDMFLNSAFAILP